MTKNLILIGGGDSSREIRWLINDINKNKKEFNLIGIVDDFKKKDTLGDRKWLIDNKNKLKMEYGEIYLICTIGDPKIRKKIAQSLENVFPFTNLIHPSAKISDTAELGNGIIICPDCIISTDTIISDHVYLNFDVFVGHDARIGKYSNLSPKTCISGHVEIGLCNFFGSSSVVLPNIKIGDNNVIGAGSVVTRNIDSNNTIIGVPGKKMLKMQL